MTTVPLLPESVPVKGSSAVPTGVQLERRISRFPEGMRYSPLRG
jgi:hypothetical protein